jgi:hypothetical protein
LLVEVSDFFRFFYPAAQEWLAGRTPYQVEGAYNPLWAWWILTPVAAWPAAQAWWLWATLSVGLFLTALLLVRRPHPLAIAALALTPASLVHLSMGQWTLWLLLGVALLQSRRAGVQGVGLLLLSLKPHLGWPFLLVTRPRAWFLLFAAALLSLLAQPRWMLDFVRGLRATPPIGYEQMVDARALGLGTPFLVGLAMVTAFGAALAWMRWRPDHRWTLAILCCVVLVITPYQRLYDNVLLFYPILLLTEQRSWAWYPLVVLLWLPVPVLAVNLSAVWIDWLLPIAVLIGIIVRLAKAPVTPQAPYSDD